MDSESSPATRHPPRRPAPPAADPTRAGLDPWLFVRSAGLPWAVAAAGFGSLPAPGDAPDATDEADSARQSREQTTRGGQAADPGSPASPGSAGEHALQDELGTTARAQRFYDDQVLDHLNPLMRDFVRRQKMMFIATADARGECDSSFRAGPPGFLHMVDERTVAWAEFRGNGVMASLGNIRENPHVGLLLVDFIQDTVGLHVNGSARIVPADEMRAEGFASDRAPAGRRVAYWVVVDVEEAYIHCSKHIPRLAEVDPSEAAAVRRTKTADYFGVASGAGLRCDVDAAS